MGGKNLSSSHFLQKKKKKKTSQLKNIEHDIIIYTKKENHVPQYLTIFMIQENFLDHWFVQ